MTTCISFAYFSRLWGAETFFASEDLEHLSALLYIRCYQSKRATQFLPRLHHHTRLRACLPLIASWEDWATLHITFLSQVPVAGLSACTGSDVLLL